MLLLDDDYTSRELLVDPLHAGHSFTLYPLYAAAEIWNTHNLQSSSWTMVKEYYNKYLLARLRLFDLWDRVVSYYQGYFHLLTRLLSGCTAF